MAEMAEKKEVRCGENLLHESVTKNSKGQVVKYRACGAYIMKRHPSRCPNTHHHGESKQ